MAFLTQRGFALVFAIWVLAILMVIVTAYAWNMQHEIQIAQGTIDTISARYLAEGGIARAIAEIKACAANSNPAYRAWVSETWGTGSTWAQLGKWDATADWTTGNLASMWDGSHSCKYYMPGQSTTKNTTDNGYFQVAVQDESGKFNVNCNLAAATYEQLAQLAGKNIPTTDLTAAQASELEADRPYRTIGDLALGSSIGGPTMFLNKSFLTIFPNYAGPAGNYELTGKININSASARVLRAVRTTSGSDCLNGNQITSLINSRNGSPFVDVAAVDAVVTAGGIGPGVLPAAVRFDSHGYYRIVARGVAVGAGVVTSDESGEAVIECYIKLTAAYDETPVQFVYWQEWWEIPGYS